MNSPDFKASEPSFRPRETPAAAGRGWGRAALAGALVVLIVLTSVLAYRWLVNDVHQRRSAMQGALQERGPAPELPLVQARPRRAELPGDAGSRPSSCAFLLAELQRQHADFLQPLPPPLLDHIAGELNWLRDQYAAAQCGPLPAALRPKAAAAPDEASAEPPAR